jgi:Mn-dependent DtxR family transcriptional regulator
MATSTSIEAYRNLDAGSLYALILGHLRDGKETCIADLAHELHLERSTVSARMNELKNMGKLQYVGKRKSHTTGITAMHFKLKTQESLW